MCFLFSHTELQPPPPKKNTAQFHHEYPCSSKVSPYAPSNPSFRLLKYPNPPKNWIDERIETASGGVNQYVLKDLMSQKDWNEIELLEREACRKKMQEKKKKEDKGKITAKEDEEVKKKQTKKTTRSTTSVVDAPAEEAPAEEAPAVTLYEERVAGIMFRKALEKNSLGWVVNWNCQIPLIVKNLQPYFIAELYRPDVWVAVDIQGELFPLVMIEVLSQKDIDLTVGELERALINQLRFYRSYDCSVKKVTGFVVPTTVTECPLLEVTMEWNKRKLRFESDMEIIANMDELIEKVETCGKLNETNVFNFVSNKMAFNPFFLPVGADVLEELFGSGAIQIYSGQSIVVAQEEHIYKL